MPYRRSHSLLLAALALAPTGAFAAGLDKEAKAFLDEVKPIMVPTEEKFYRNLKEKSDRTEFEKIFWARRDPDLETPVNEYRTGEFDKRRAEADAKFKVGGKGSQTDCGRIYILLGPPEEVKQKEGSGVRKPETWSYNGGKAKIDLDDTCRIPQGVKIGDELNRLAEDRILHPNIDYRMGADGKLTKLVDLLPKPSPAQTLLKTPREDFQVSDTHHFLRTGDGGTALVGVVRGEGALASADVVVVAQALGEDGKLAAFSERPLVAAAKDGGFFGTYVMQLKPGKYTLKYGALDPKSEKGGLKQVPMEVPNFSSGDLSMTIVALAGLEEAGATPDIKNAYSAYTFGTNRLIPMFGGTWPTTAEPEFYYAYYDAGVDPATTKGSLAIDISLMKDGVVKAKLQDAAEEAPIGAKSVGPIPLAKYGAGSYKMKIQIKDKVANKETSQELAFEVK